MQQTSSVHIPKPRTWIFTKAGTVRSHYMVTEQLNFSSYLPNVTVASYTAPFIHKQSPQKCLTTQKKKLAHDTAYKFCY